MESRAFFSQTGFAQRQIWTQERLKVSKIKEGCKAMARTESLQRTVFIRELIWKEMECEMAARTSALGTVASAAQSVLRRPAKAQLRAPSRKAAGGCPATTNC